MWILTKGKSKEMRMSIPPPPVGELHVSRMRRFLYAMELD